MKKEIHPKNYRPVIFEDTTVGARFLISSVVDSKEEGEWTDGKTYPIYKIEISSASHPFYTGTENIIDTAGRVEKFKARAAAKKPKQTKKAEK
jgi:large subunit ribosomal protein L31